MQMENSLHLLSLISSTSPPLLAPSASSPVSPIPRNPRNSTPSPNTHLTKTPIFLFPPIKNPLKSQIKMTQLIKTQSFSIISTWALLIFIVCFNFANSISIYEELKSYGLPMGLLPKGVTNYTLDDESGMLEVYLDQPCNVKFESELHYETNVTGRLSDGQIGNLTGISAQDLFLWFLVKGIRVDMPSSGLVHFDVGVVDKQFSLSWFEIPLDCVAAERPQVDLDEGRFANDILLAKDSDKEPADGARGVM